MDKKRKISVIKQRFNEKKIIDLLKKVNMQKNYDI